MYNYGHMAGVGFIGIILTVLFWVAFIWLIVALVRSLSNHNKEFHGHDHKNCHCGEIPKIEVPQKNPALDVLKIRYAKGEIGKGEFEDKKKDIM